MRLSIPVIAVGLVTLGTTQLAFAQSPASAPAAGDKKPAPAAPAQASGVRKDPKGIKGISPFWEAINKADSALVARDFEGAIAGYREAITSEPQNPLGHYRMGEAQLAKGDMTEAEQSWVSALRFVGEDHRLHGKILFVMADLRERQKSYDDATQRWNDYAKFVIQQPEAKGFPGTADERKKRIEDWKRISAESAEVKKRIDARLKEADESVKKSSK